MEIVEQFLTNAEGIKRTHLLHKMNMSYKLFIDYLDLLLYKNLLLEKEEGKSRVYYVTDKGSKLLENINEIIDNFRK